MKHEPDEPPCPGDALEPYGVLHSRCSLTRRLPRRVRGRGPAIVAGVEYVCATA